jgi:uncharacterized protein YciW
MDQDSTILRLAGVAPGTDLAAALERREEILRLSGAAEKAVLAPAAPGGLSHAERAALACRMALMNADEKLAGHYRGMFEAAGAPGTLAALLDPAAGADAAGANGAGDARLRAILRHVDMVTRAPRQATRADIEALKAAGVEEADIVRLSELVAFVNYQARVIAGLRLLGRTP